MTGRLAFVPAPLSATAARRWMDGLAVLLLACVILRIVLEFLNPAYDWDLDHEIYFGQRLLHGELLWTREFHDKLPVVPVLFLLPAWLKTVTAYRALSLIVVLLAAWCLGRLLPAVAGLDRRVDPMPRILRLGALIYVAAMLFLPGSIAVMNPLVASLELICVLLMLWLAGHPARGLRLVAGVLLAGLCGAFALSARPYLMGELAAVTIGAASWAAAIRPGSTAGKLRRGVGVVALWTLVFAFWGGVLNVLPYALSGQMAAFADGVRLLAEGLAPSMGPRTFLRQLARPNALAFWAIMIWLLVAARRHEATVGGLPRQGRMTRRIIAIGAALTWLFMMSQHYWGHYVLLFVGPFTILVVLHLASFVPPLSSGAETARGATGETPWWFVLGPVALVALISLGEIGVRGPRVIQALVVHAPAGEDRAAEEVANYLARAGGDRRPDFLFPSQMRTHWRLDEFRHGFPHAANTGHVFRGWWAGIAPSTRLITPPDGNAYCREIDRLGPEIIFALPGKDAIRCIEAPGSAYRHDATLRGNIHVFRRKAASEP